MVRFCLGINNRSREDITHFVIDIEKPILNKDLPESRNRRRLYAFSFKSCVFHERFAHSFSINGGRLYLCGDGTSDVSGVLGLVSARVAVCAAHAAVGNEGLKRIAGVLKWTVTSILTVLLLVFVGYLTVSGVIAGTADAVAVKAAKFTVSSMVPVVGGILSDAAETVLAGAGILKNAVGVFGMLVILSMCVVPFLQLGIHYLAYKLTAALAATVADGRTSGLIDGLGGAFGLILGMTGASAMLLLVSMVSAVSMVTP